jgi:PTH1 family peptidyl-tRNA hydrolase
MTDGQWLIAGLGNPGPRYAGNRHNAGFMVADILASRAGAGFRSAAKFRAETASGRLAGLPVVIVKPLTFMNESGIAVRGLSGYHRIPPERIAVVHDELDLPFGGLRLKLGGGDNGHNGLRSLTSHLGTPDYYRVRFGIGRPPGRQDAADFVLRDFSQAERRELDLELDRAADAVEALLSAGLPAAQNQFHSGGSTTSRSS